MGEVDSATSDTLVTYDLCVANNVETWTQTTFDLSSYLGQTIRLVFETETDESAISSFFLDDVQLSVNDTPTTRRARTDEHTDQCASFGDIISHLSSSKERRRRQR
ncbi:MAG: hypothetical protein R3E79_04255 [Caldilineaceae bacterium]